MPRQTPDGIFSRINIPHSHTNGHTTRLLRLSITVQSVGSPKYTWSNMVMVDVLRGSTFVIEDTTSPISTTPPTVKSSRSRSPTHKRFSVSSRLQNPHRSLRPVLAPAHVLGGDTFVRPVQLCRPCRRCHVSKSERHQGCAVRWRAEVSNGSGVIEVYHR